MFKKISHPIQYLIISKKLLMTHFTTNWTHERVLTASLRSEVLMHPLA